jgi:hypothetical protein
MAYYSPDFVLGMLRLVAVAALLLSAPVASASLLESLTAQLFGTVEDTSGPLPADHVHYQADAGTEYDAPDTCDGALASPDPFDLPIDAALDGWLVPADDEADHYRVPVGQDLVGGRISLSVLGHDAELPFAIDAFMPGCGGSVTAEENQPAAPLAHPAPAEGERQVAPHNLGASGGECSDRWFFVMNQFGHLAPPATIHLAWSDGSQADIPILKDTPATLAQYEAPDNGFTLDSVTANVPDEWTGQFNVGEAPCDLVDGEAVFGEPAVVSADGTTIEFTPITAGTYVLAVRFVPPALPALPEASLGVPSLVVPASCHAICGFAPGTATDMTGYTAAARNLT